MSEMRTRIRQDEDLISSDGHHGLGVEERPPAAGERARQQQHQQRQQLSGDDSSTGPKNAGGVCAQ